MAAITPTEVSSKIWSLSHVLRDDGIVFHKYLSELTYLLFLKIADELKADADLPQGCRWPDLVEYKGKSLVGHYRKMLTRLGEDSKSLTVREIFGFPTTVFSHDENLRRVISGIASIDWSALRGDGFGMVYESLLERNATESRAGAGQYFTPRPLVECIVALVNPEPGKVIQDPASGTGGFLISAWEQIRKTHPRARNALAKTRFEGAEIERDTYRLCLMNLFLHGIDGRIIHGDALTDDVKGLSTADIVLANPPFGSGAGSARARRGDLPFPTSNKQLMFLQHIVSSLRNGGSAAVVVPDNVLFEGGAGRKTRTLLMERCALHTVLRLPQGIFYAQGVNTNVLFFEKGEATEEVWFYDFRTNQRRFSKTNPVNDKTFEPVVAALLNRNRTIRRKIATSDKRLKCYSRREIAERLDNLDVTWLPNASAAHEIDDIQVALDELTNELKLALSQIEKVEKEIAGR